MIGVVLGTRPEIIKLAPVIWELRKRRVRFAVIHTGQHYDYNMSKIFFEQLDLGEPDFFLGAGGGAGCDSDARQTGKMMVALERLFLEKKIETIAVEGDTNSVLAGALAAKKIGRRLAHVEAGARSFDRAMPEEVNRVVCDHLSDVLFAPNAACKRNLLAEKMPRDRIMLSGNTQFAAMRRVLEKTRGMKLPFSAPKEFVLVTVHRQENTARSKLAFLARLLASLDSPKIFVVHPRTAAAIKENRLGGAFRKAGARLAAPVGYAEILNLTEKGSAVITDSGGLQKEAAALGKPVLIPRAATEWPEITASGHACLVGLNAASGRAARRFLDSFDSRKTKKIPEVAGNPAKKIVDCLLKP